MSGKQKSVYRQEEKDGWLLVAPLLLLLMLFIFYPVVSNFYYSFTRWNGIGTPQWAGLSNYRRMLADEKFLDSLKNLFVLVLYIPLGVFFPLLFSAFMRDGIRGWKTYRAVLYLPSILGPVLLGTLFSIMLSQVGPFIDMLGRLGVENAREIHLLGRSRSAIHTMSFLFVVWMRMGFGCIYFLAAMSNIDDTLYDAATIDGAGWWKKFYHVTVPGISFAIQFFTVLAFIEVFARMYGLIYTLTGGGPGYATYTLEFGVYMISFKALQKGYAASWSVVLFLLCAIIAFIQIRLLKKGEE